MMVWRKAYIAIGSNLGDRLAAIHGALAALDADEEVWVLRVSTIIETAPVGPPGQGPYLNAAAELRTRLSPRAMLDRFLEIEATFGRDRANSRKWGPRTLDIDLLFYGDRGETVLDEPGPPELTIPHPRLHERSFVLTPLAEIAGNLVHPVLKLSVHELGNRILQPVPVSEYSPLGPVLKETDG